MNTVASIGDIVGWFLGVAITVEGVLHWLGENDLALGAALLLISVIYCPPANAFLKKRLGISIPYSLKIIVGLLIVWLTLAEGAIAEGYYPEMFY